MDNEGEQKLAVEGIQRLAWRYFRTELLKTGTPPTFAAVREWVEGFEGTRMSGPMFGAAQMDRAFDLEVSLREWYTDWLAGRFLEPIAKFPVPSLEAHDDIQTKVLPDDGSATEVLPDDATMWELALSELRAICGWIASAMRECIEIRDELKGGEPGFLRRLLGYGKTRVPPDMLLRSGKLATTAVKDMSYLERQLERAARLYGQPPAEAFLLHKIGADLTLAMVSLNEYLSGFQTVRGSSAIQSMGWTEFELRFTTGTLRYLEFVRGEDLRNAAATDSMETLPQDGLGANSNQ